jgi:hypothetical protein
MGAGSIFRTQEHIVKVCGESNHTENQLILEQLGTWIYFSIEMQAEVPDQWSKFSQEKKFGHKS